MEVIKYDSEDILYYVFLDLQYRVVELPSLYLLSIHNHSLRYSVKSIEHYCKVLCYFTEFLEQRYKLPVDKTLASINGVVISDYLKLLKDKGLQASTIRNREVIIRNFLTWLTTEEAGYVRNNNGYSSYRYKSPSPSLNSPKYRTVYEIIQFINLLYDESQRCLVHFLFDSGLRISEVPRVKKSDLPTLNDFSDDAVYFDINVKGSKGRGGMVNERKTFLTRAVIQRINRLHKQHPVYKKATKLYGEQMPCFLNVKGKPITDSAIKNLLFKAAQRGGLDPSKYSSHKFRHSFAVSVLISEFDSEFLNKLVITRDALGHKDIKSTEIYSSISPAAIKNLQMLNQEYDIVNRFEESQHIYNKTYLATKQHKEKRGRS